MIFYLQLQKAAFVLKISPVQTYRFATFLLLFLIFPYTRSSLELTDFSEFHPPSPVVDHNSQNIPEANKFNREDNVVSDKQRERLNCSAFIAHPSVLAWAEYVFPSFTLKSACLQTSDRTSHFLKVLQIFSGHFCVLKAMNMRMQGRMSLLKIFCGDL